MKKKYKYDLEIFDHRAWLEYLGIEYYTKGSNVGKGWIGINCPFCSDGDTGNHLGIREENKVIKCFRCKTKGNIITLIKKLQGEKQLSKTLKRFTNGNSHTNLPKHHTNTLFCSECVLPKKSTTKILVQHGNYLKNRKYSPKKLYEKYNLHSVNICPYWGHRIIIPIYNRKKLITFIGRDITGTAKIRYKACPKEKSVIDTKGLIYNLHTATDRLILVEGVTDVWRIGNGCGAIMGTEFDNRQILHIINSNIKEVFILFDNDVVGKQAAKIWGAALSAFISTYIINLEIFNIEDPDDLEINDVNNLRKEIFGKIY
jgi:DNA primase